MALRCDYSWHARTQPRLGGACRPHGCACVRDEFVVCTSLAMYVPYINTWRSHIYTYIYIYICGVPRSDRYARIRNPDVVYPPVFAEFAEE